MTVKADNAELKTCSRCKTPKLKSCFRLYIRKGRKVSLRSWCRVCESDYMKQRWARDPQARERNKKVHKSDSYQKWVKEYRKRPDLKEKYRETKKKSNKNWRTNNKSLKSSLDKRWRALNKEKCRNHYKEWCAANNDKIKSYSKKASDNLRASYVRNQMRQRGFTKDVLTSNPELIEIYRKILKIKRYVKEKSSKKFS